MGKEDQHKRPAPWPAKQDSTMKRVLQTFFRDDSGAVTVDWVVLTASVIILMGVAFGAVRTGTVDLSTNLSTYMASQ